MKTIHKLRDKRIKILRVKLIKEDVSINQEAKQNLMYLSEKRIIIQ